MAEGEYKLIKMNSSSNFDEKTIQVQNNNVLGFDENYNPKMISMITHSESLRANINISGGGTISVDSNGNLKWTQRFSVISNGKGSHFATAGYFNIECPTSGTITGVGGASDVTATANGIPITAWQALYYILPIGETSTSLPANFRIATYHSDLEIPDNWVLVAIRNGQNDKYYIAGGYKISVNQSINTNSYDAVNADMLDGLHSSSFAQSTHKYHTIAANEELYDNIYGTNNLNIYLQSMYFDVFRFRPYTNVKYYNGSAWISWEQKLDNLFDGQIETNYNISSTNKKFQFEITRSAGYPGNSLFCIQTSWSDITNVSCTVVIETYNTSTGTWIQKENWTYSQFQIGTNVRCVPNLHDGLNQTRVTLSFDWTAGTNHDYIQLRRIMLLSNFSGLQPLLPFSWDYNQKLFAKSLMVNTNVTSDSITTNKVDIDGDLKTEKIWLKNADGDELVALSTNTINFNLNINGDADYCFNRVQIGSLSHLSDLDVTGKLFLEGYEIPNNIYSDKTDGDLHIGYTSGSTQIDGIKLRRNDNTVQIGSSNQLFDLEVKGNISLNRGTDTSVKISLIDDDSEQAYISQDFDVNVNDSRLKIYSYSGIKIGDTGKSLQLNQFTLPTNDGTSGQVLSTNGAGQLGWSKSLFKEINDTLASNSSTSNIAIGLFQESPEETGNNNISIGVAAGLSSIRPKRNINIGDHAGYYDSCSDNVSIGTSAGASICRNYIINATDIEINKIYIIYTVGTTDYTQYGSSSNTIGTSFTATGIPTGTGTVIVGCSKNVAIGYNTLNSSWTTNYPQNYNVAIGSNVFYDTGAIKSIGIGEECGTGGIVIRCIYIGSEARGKYDSQIYTHNEIVIGCELEGNGDNTVTIGNSNITDNYFNGKLHTTESISIGNDTSTATSDNVGSIRYRRSGNNSYCEMVMQTGASTYAWVIIKQNSW